MGNSTLVNNLSPITKGSNGVALCFPDICKTPTPAGPVPIPYANVAKSGDLASGTTTVKIDGQPVSLSTSNLATSTGDEPGSAGGGAASSKIKGPSAPIMHSFDVTMDGKPIVRNTDLHLNNGKNTPPAPIMQAQQAPALAGHSEPDPECPFCPVEKLKGYKTYPGKANDSGKLADAMENPKRLPQLQPGCRPKDGEPEQQGASQARRQPKPIYSHPDHGPYSCEAHHAISGNQALKGHPVEAWICKDKGKISQDTGYSVNNSDNGVWLPSIPEARKDGTWGSLPPGEKMEIAFVVMAAGKGQFHKGGHDIRDPDDLAGEYHFSYKSELKKRLGQLNDRIRLWSSVCFTCSDKDPQTGPFDPNWKVHDRFDRLSADCIYDLKRSAKDWDYFISKAALNYHKKFCIHCQGEVL